MSRWQAVVWQLSLEAQEILIITGCPHWAGTLATGRDMRYPPVGLCMTGTENVRCCTTAATATEELVSSEQWIQYKQECLAWVRVRLSSNI